MATLPSPDPERFGRVHLLRRSTPPLHELPMEAKRAVEKARADASLWRGIALTLLAMLILMAIGNCTESGRRWRNEYYREAGGYER